MGDTAGRGANSLVGVVEGGKNTLRKRARMAMCPQVEAPRGGHGTRARTRKVLEVNLSS